MEKSEILKFVRQMKPRDHVIFFYSRPEDKRRVLFTYLKAGLDSGEAIAYVAGQESPDEIKRAMKRFGIDVDAADRSGALRVIDYRDWYMIDGKFSIPKTKELWKRLYNESTAKGFKGFRVTGEMAWFFESRMVKELLEYEQSLHRVLELPMTAICAYDSDVVASEERGEIYLDLIKAHSNVIIVGPESGIVTSH
jgi:hypothetical protein